MKRLQDLDVALRVSGIFLLLAIVGWWLHSFPLAIVSVLGGLTAASLYIWERDCLLRVSYQRRLEVNRADFGAEVRLELILVNDKILPLPWLQIDDAAPALLEVSGATLNVSRFGRDATMVTVLPMLPYQRIRRTYVVHCGHRGDHVFGPGQLLSGDPVGWRERRVPAPGQAHLLVYPKVFALAPAGVASRVLVGDIRARQQLVEDPTRIIGIRDYRPGDARRSVDWRATARTGNLKVRICEPTTSVRVGVFVDFRSPRHRMWAEEVPEVEFTVSVAASIVSELLGRAIPTGLYSSGSIAGRHVEHPPSGEPGQLATLLESLARANQIGGGSLGTVLTQQVSRLGPGASAIVVAADFPGSTIEGIAELRRRHAVAAVWIENPDGAPPPRRDVDELLQVPYQEDWPQIELLQLRAGS